jgi:hypothetical protein
MVKRREQQDQQQRDEEIEHQGEQMHAEELQEAEAERRSRVLIREQGWPEPGEVICPPWKGPSQPLASIAELTDPVKVQALAASMGMEHSCRDPESKEDRRTWSCELEDRSWLFEVRVTEYLTEEAAAAALARVEEQEDEQFDSSVMRHQGRWWASFWVENGPCAELLRDQVIPLGRSMAILHGEVFAERIRATGLDIPDGCYTEEWSGAYSTKCTIFGNHVHGDFNLSTMRGDERDAPNERRMIVGGKACVEDIAGGAYAMLTDKASCEAVATAMLGPSQP